MIVRVLLSLALPAALAFAQVSGTATLVGTVTDTTGAIVPGAKVLVVNQNTQFTSNTVSNQEGYYYVPYLSPGTYNLTIESSGFKRYVRNGIDLRTNESPRIDAQLEIGNVAESIEITGAAPLLETETTVAGGILESETINKIPVLQKLAFRILPYLPSTQVVNGLHIAGQRERSMAYTLDGLSGKEPVLGAVNATNAVVTSTIDAYSEVKAYTTGVPAEFGHSAGGQIAAVFKSGTNQFHGNLEDRYINKTMMHRNYFDVLPTQPITYHELTGVLSGPVILPKLYDGRNKTFWLFGLARHHEKASETYIGDVPDALMYNGDFNFIDPATGRNVGNTIYDPASTRQLPDGTWTRDPFANKVVPKNRFDPVANNFLAKNPFAPPNAAPGFVDRIGPHQNLVVNTTYRSYRTRFDMKIDHQFSPKNKMYARYSQSHHRAFNGRWIDEAAWKVIDPNFVPIPIDQINAIIADTYTLTPTLINEFRAGMNRRKGSRTPASAGQGWAKQLGIPGVNDATFPDFRGTIFYGQFFRTGPGGASQEVGEDFSFQNNLTKVSGKHTFKGGYELIRTRYNALVEALPSGRYFMGGTDFPFAPANSSGHDWAALLLGSVSRAQFTVATATWLPRWWSQAWFFQNDWKPIRGLTVNMGVRWSYESPFNTKYGQHSQFDPGAKDPISGLAGAIVHNRQPLYSRDWNNFQPRIGLAWNFRPKLVFRSNFGLSSQDIFTNGRNQQFEEYFATASIQPPPGDPRSAFRLSQGPPAFSLTLAPDGSVPFVGTNYSGRAASWFDPNMRMPYIMNWSGGVQWEFMPSVLLETIYQGTAGVRLLNNWDMNLVRLDISRDPVELERVRQQVQNFRPFPQFGSIQHYSNYGHNTYHGWTTRVEKRYKKGLFLNAFFTWSKALDDVDGDGGGGGVTFYNRSLEKGRGAYDVAKRFVAVGIWELPYGKGRKWGNRFGFADKILGGWELMVSQTIQSGPPITVSFTNPGANYLPMQQRPIQILPNDKAVTQGWNIGGNRLPTTAQNRYLNPEAFAYPAAFTSGTLGRNTLESPGLIWMQASIAKTWTFWERIRFQLRWDTNNPYKRPNFSDPSRNYNVAALGPFGRFTGDRGSFSDLGGRTHHYLVLRLEW